MSGADCRSRGGVTGNHNLSDSAKIEAMLSTSSFFNGKERRPAASEQLESVQTGPLALPMAATEVLPDLGGWATVKLKQTIVCLFQFLIVSVSVSQFSGHPATGQVVTRRWPQGCVSGAERPNAARAAKGGYGGDASGISGRRPTGEQACFTS